MTLRVRFEQLNLQSILKFVESSQEEHYQLDFKRVGDPSLDRSDRKNLAKALSGFANSAGGIIIWGVMAKRISNIDVAFAVEPIDDLPRFLSSLNGLTGDMVSPIVDGVEHKKIEAHETGRGYVATLVPASQSGPHMAMGGEYRYFKRSGDSFYRLEHFDLEDMFGRRPKPDLGLCTEQLGIPRQDLTLVLGLRNKGRGIAKYPYFHVEVDPPYEISSFELDGNGNPGMPILYQHSMTGKERKYVGTSDIVIYPDTDLHVTCIRIRRDSRGVSEDQPCPDLTLRASFCAEGVMIRHEDFALSGRIIHNALFG